MAKKRKLLLFRGDKPLWIIVTALFLVSLLVVYSATAAMAYREVDGNTSYYLFRQARFIMIGFFLIIVVHWIDYKYYARFAKALFKVSIVLVILAYVIGVSLNDAARWIRIPVLGFTFQPSELLKITLVMVVAQQLGIRQNVITKIPILPPFNPAVRRMTSMCCMIRLSRWVSIFRLPHCSKAQLMQKEAAPFTVPSEVIRWTTP